MKKSDTRRTAFGDRGYGRNLSVSSVNRKKRIEVMPESLGRDCGIERRPESDRHHNMVKWFLEMSTIVF